MSTQKQQSYRTAPGMQSNLEFALRFAQWMQARRRQAAISDMMERWGMSRATAYRYKAIYDSVIGGDA
ncbi:hypothetical protein ACE15N_13085 [Xanthomonas campestris pv. passiflorae]|uniref:hypothetical protein n=1 Tax=Xanthomonas TaxID=338 RepID=UPI00141B29B9|nr:MULTISPECIES: hypothetical protein [Xanthomonas]MBV6816049.1 hypothetical protein [Xanthomonas campestris pv. passiflorae]NIK17386.1 hypothetical protein [Xanthomonas cannabis]